MASVSGPMLVLTPLDIAATLLAGGGIIAGVGVGLRLLVRREGSRRANVAFGAFLLVAAALVLYVLLLAVQPPGEHLGIVFAPLPFTFAIGPLLYAYVQARLGRGRPHAIHAVLPLAQATLVLGIGASPRTVQAWYMAEVFAPFWETAQNVLFVLSLAAYLAGSHRAIRSAEPPAFAWARARDRWLRKAVTGGAVALAGVVVFSLVGPLMASAPGQRFWGHPAVGFVETVLYSAVLYAIALGGLVQAEARAAAPVARKEMYGVDDALAEVHADALQRLMVTERPYLDPNLTLGSLANQLGVTEKVLSLVLNSRLGMSYTGYVNGLRVDEARRRLTDPSHAHLSVLAVGLDAGFASKSTFNRVFKERTGETPSAFRAGLSVS